jgi:hypothetical protein
VPTWKVPERSMRIPRIADRGAIAAWCGSVTGQSRTGGALMETYGNGGPGQGKMKEG